MSYIIQNIKSNKVILKLFILILVVYFSTMASMNNFYRLVDMNIIPLEGNGFYELIDLFISSSWTFFIPVISYFFVFNNIIIKSDMCILRYSSRKKYIKDKMKYLITLILMYVFVIYLVAGFSIKSKLIVYIEADFFINIVILLILNIMVLYIYSLIVLYASEFINLRYSVYITKVIILLTSIVGFYSDEFGWVLNISLYNFISINTILNSNKNVLSSLFLLMIIIVILNKIVLYKTSRKDFI